MPNLIIFSRVLSSTAPAVISGEGHKLIE